jgi:hypothetical protein
MPANGKCGFCGGVHGDECPEFPKLPAPTPMPNAEHLADYATRPRLWVCHCKVSITATAPEAVEQDWLLHEKNGVVWAECPLCSLSEREAMRADIAEWEHRGSRRGNN